MDDLLSQIKNPLLRAYSKYIKSPEGQYFPNRLYPNKPITAIPTRQDINSPQYQQFSSDMGKGIGLATVAPVNMNPHILTRPAESLIQNVNRKLASKRPITIQEADAITKLYEVEMPVVKGVQKGMIPLKQMIDELSVFIPKQGLNQIQPTNNLLQGIRRLTIGGTPTIR